MSYQFTNKAIIMNLSDTTGFKTWAWLTNEQQRKVLNALQIKPGFGVAPDRKQYTFHVNSNGEISIFKNNQFTHKIVTQ